MNEIRKFLKKYFQSFRLQRTSVSHSVRKNEKALESYKTFLRKSSNFERNWNIFIPSPVFNDFIHWCIIHKKRIEIFIKWNYYFHCYNTEQKIIIPYSGINQPDGSQQCCINNYKHIHTAVRCSQCKKKCSANLKTRIK
jgi:hypothetical protein